MLNDLLNALAQSKATNRHNSGSKGTGTHVATTASARTRRPRGPLPRTGNLPIEPKPLADPGDVSFAGKGDVMKPPAPRDLSKVKTSQLTIEAPRSGIEQELLERCINIYRTAFNKSKGNKKTAWNAVVSIFTAEARRRTQHSRSGKVYTYYSIGGIRYSKADLELVRRKIEIGGGRIQVMPEQEPAIA